MLLLGGWGHTETLISGTQYLCGEKQRQDFAEESAQKHFLDSWPHCFRLKGLTTGESNGPTLLKH